MNLFTHQRSLSLITLNDLMAPGLPLFNDLHLLNFILLNFISVSHKLSPAYFVDFFNFYQISIFCNKTIRQEKPVFREKYSVSLALKNQIFENRLIWLLKKTWKICQNNLKKFLVSSIRNHIFIKLVHIIVFSNNIKF